MIGPERLLISRLSSVQEQGRSEHHGGHKREDREVSGKVDDHSAKNWEENDKNVERPADPKVERKDQPET